MKALAVILLFLGADCHAQETNDITSKVVERDTNKDGRPDFRVETVYRQGQKVMLIWSKPDAKGILRVSSRSYFAGGDMMTTESDEDRDGVLETITVYRASTKDLEVFTRKQDGSVAPVSGQKLAAYKKKIAAIDEFWDKAFDKDTSTEKAMELMDETRLKVQDPEKEKRDAKR